MMESLKRQLPVLLAVLLSLAILLGLFRHSTRRHWQQGMVVSLGEIQVVHPEVRVGARQVRGVLRFASGQVIETGASGRARIRIDDGTSLVMDRSTALLTSEKGIELKTGRLFVLGAPSARTEVSMGTATTVVASSTLAFELTASGARVYCVDGDSMVVVGGKQDRVRSGETATIQAGDLRVAPEKAFNDWTGGMAGAWSASGRPRAAIGEIWGRASEADIDPGSPLALRSHVVNVRLEGEVATTRIESTYFNAGSSSLFGDFRLALPRQAVVSRFAVKNADGQSEGVVAAGQASGAKVPRLEWAGLGWLRGGVPAILPGQEVTVIVEYIEWLSAASGTMTYRYPMIAEDSALLVADFRARVEMSGLRPLAVRAGLGAVVRGDVVEVHQADFRPQSDLVVEIDVSKAAAGPARAYVTHAGRERSVEDDYLLARVDMPKDAAPPGIALAIVMDTSRSIDPALLDAERALVEAILEGLGSPDRVLVLAGDQAARPVGPDRLGPVDAARRKAVLEALGDLRPGGATDLGVVLEHAAQSLPADAVEPVILYVGDGEVTVGDANADLIRSRLERRAGGMPRLVSVAVGPDADAALLAALAGPREPIFQIENRADAARTAIDILVQALRPAALGVELDLGPTVDRIYPRGAQAVIEDEPLTVVGRVRGEVPKEAVLRYQRGGRIFEQRLALDLVKVVHSADIRRRWAAERIDDLARRGEGRETIVDLAVRAHLLTPWTGFYAGSPAGPFEATPLLARSLDMSWPSSRGSLLSGRGGLGQPGPERSGAVLDERSLPDRSLPAPGKDDVSLLLTAAANRVLDEASPLVRKCQDMAAVFRPQAAGKLHVTLNLDGGGRIGAIAVRAADPRATRDYWLYRCVYTVIQGLRFFDVGTNTKVRIEHDYTLSPSRDTQKTQCSPTSRLSLPIKRGIWSARLSSGAQSMADVYRKAKQACELAGWPDRRTLVDVILEQEQSLERRLPLAQELDEAGEGEAAKLIRRETIRQAKSSHDLARIRDILAGHEPEPGAEFEKQYGAARSDESRLSVLRRFLGLAPHNSRLRRAEIVLLEGLGRTDELLTELSALRQDPFSDVLLLCDAASALRRVGRESEASRAFGEIIERSPFDPSVRAVVGDRMRAEGLLDPACAAYESLAALSPSDPTALLRLGLAHAGAGRLDVATRMLDRVAQTGGRAGDPRTGELAAITAAVLLAEARSNPAGTPASSAAGNIAPASVPTRSVPTLGISGTLSRRALALPLPDVAGLLLVRAPVVDYPVAVRLTRSADSKTETPPDLDAAPLGLFAVRVERGEKDLRIRLQRPSALASRALKADVSLLLLHDDQPLPELVSKAVELRADGKPVELRWDGATLL